MFPRGAVSRVCGKFISVVDPRHDFYFKSNFNMPTRACTRVKHNNFDRAACSLHLEKTKYQYDVHSRAAVLMRHLEHLEVAVGCSSGAGVFKTKRTGCKQGE